MKAKDLTPLESESMAAALREQAPANKKGATASQKGDLPAFDAASMGATLMEYARNYTPRPRLKDRLREPAIFNAIEILIAKGLSRGQIGDVLEEIGIMTKSSFTQYWNEIAVKETVARNKRKRNAA